MLYLLDANVLIDANRDYYPISRVPEFWDWLAHVTKQQVVKVPLEIYDELVQGNDALNSWAKNFKQQILLHESIERKLVNRVITEGYAADLDDEEIEKIGKDPFLIAYALADRKNRCIVTTEASKPRRTRANRHVPDVCRDLEVNFCGPFQFIRELDFRTDWNT